MRGASNLSRDEAKEMSFVPSAITIPQRPMFWCDNQCSGKALRFWQFCSVVVEDGEESYTANLCQQCYNESLKRSWARNAGVHLDRKRLKAKKFLKDAEKEKQQGIQGQWQQESVAKEYLEQAKCCADTDCTPRMMKIGKNKKHLQGRSEGHGMGIRKNTWRIRKSGKRSGGKVEHRTRNSVEEYRCGVSLRQPEDKEVLLCRSHVACVSQTLVNTKFG